MLPLVFDTGIGCATGFGTVPPIENIGAVNPVSGNITGQVPLLNPMLIPGALVIGGETSGGILC